MKECRTYHILHVKAEGNLWNVLKMTYNKKSHAWNISYIILNMGRAKQYGKSQSKYDYIHSNTNQLTISITYSSLFIEGRNVKYVANDKA
jgi:hypothetical protein